MSLRPQPIPGRRSRRLVSPADQAGKRAAQRDVLQHHITRIKKRCTVAELAHVESRTALSLRIVLFADALLQADMLGNIEDLKANATELTVRSLLKSAFLGDSRKVERILDSVAASPPADQAAFCDFVAEVGWRLFEGPLRSSPDVRAG